MKTKILEIEAKSILTPSKLPDADYVLNPYTGCEFGCIYCYASFMGRFVDQSISDWGSYVYVKTNAIELLRNDLKRLSLIKRHSTILLSSVTDPYQGVEKKYRLTRGLLEVLIEESYPGLVSILTKSPLVLRDIDLLKQLPCVDVGVTITTTDDKLSRFLELRAPLASKRLITLKELHNAGINTYAFVGPLLPHFRYQPELLEELFASLAEAKVKSIFVEHINLKPYIKARLWETLQHASAEVKNVYNGAPSPEHREILNEMVTELVKKYKLNLRLGQVIYHNENQAMLTTK